ncbi:nucleotidyltransferase family protein [Sphingomonas aliaeris]|uniref:Nucleotidyltransferase family protein n=1 Tax=Sphingomonas aliaeris TaxID=2759526 RepID=A0A974S5H8_9SPHN|nr:nucleotidyltransferase family protein [Sphingomonas aliaeris]QQV78446.1 nucleotidyltransferase family protein [Sphingomonas aliaeris]
MSDGWLLARALRSPGQTLELDAGAWTDLLAIARAEQMIGTLAHRLNALELPGSVQRILTDARASAEQGRVAALWEAEVARRVLAPLGVPVVLLKGTAFVAAGLKAGQGRSIGDLDILVPRAAIDAVEKALLRNGWEWVKPDPYDDAYYRRWMHELPPLIHRDRDRMIDVHHTILPLTARITPDADALLDDSVEIAPGVRTLSPNDMLVHAAAHLFADGDLAGGMRNLWDVHCLIEEYGSDGLMVRAQQHGLGREMKRALRLASALYGDAEGVSPVDWLYLRRMTARDGWGRPRRMLVRQAFYIRSHWIRMPPTMLARHLWTKWRKGAADRGSA